MDRYLKKVLLLVLSGIIFVMTSQGQVLNINNISVSDGEFSYSRGDSIYIAGDNDTVVIDSAMVMTIKAPKICLAKDTKLGEFETGSFKAFYDSYAKMVVDPMIQPVNSTSLGEISLTVSGGTPPYSAKWISFEPEDSMLFISSTPLMTGDSYEDYLSDLSNTFNSMTMTNCLPGKYSCVIEDSHTSNHYSFIVGNLSNTLALTNCALVNGDITTTQSYSWNKCGFIYESYLPKTSDWTFGYSILDSEQSEYSLGISNTTSLLSGANDLLYGVYVNGGVLYPILDGVIDFANDNPILEHDMVIISHEAEHVSIYLNNKLLVSRNEDATDTDLFLKGGICSGNIGNPQLYNGSDDLPLDPEPLSPEVNISATDLLCGLNYSGSICSSSPNWTTWPAGFDGSSGCITGVPAGSYNLTINPPGYSAYTENVRIGYEAVWNNIDELSEFSLSGLQNNTASFGYAQTTQIVSDLGGDIWAEFEIDYDEYGGSVVLGISNAPLNSQNQWNGIFAILTLDPNNNQILVQGRDNSGFHNFGIAPMSSSVVRISANSSNWTVHMDDLALQNGALNYVSPTPNLMNSSAFVQISPGENVVVRAITSFGCEEVINYAKLSKKIDGQLIPVTDQVIHFSFVEPYLDDGQGNQIVLTKYSGNTTTENIIPFNPEYGYKEYDLDISSYGFVDGDSGLITLTSEKGEKWYLKFRIEE